jgi:hypothetical protein
MGAAPRPPGGPRLPSRLRTFRMSGGADMVIEEINAHLAPSTRAGLRFLTSLAGPCGPTSAYFGRLALMGRSRGRGGGTLLQIRRGRLQMEGRARRPGPGRSDRMTVGFVSGKPHAGSNNSERHLCSRSMAAPSGSPSGDLSVVRGGGGRGLNAAAQMASR